MDSHRKKQFSDFVDWPSKAQIAALVGRVRAIPGADELTKLHTVHIRSIETSLYECL